MGSKTVAERGDEESTAADVQVRLLSNMLDRPAIIP